MSERKPNWFQRTIQNMFLSDEFNRPSAVEKVVVVHGDNIGTTGTRVYDGYVQEEYLHNLKGYRRADEFDKMRRSDATVMMLLNSIKNLIRSAQWEVQEGEDSDEARSDAEFIKHLLFEGMETSFENFINEAITFLDFGHSVFEVTHKIVEKNPKFGNYIGIKNFSWRSPRTIERWNLDPETGKLASVTQISYGDLDKYVDIPAEYLLVYTLNKEGSNYEGISMLRPCYGSYLRKKVYMKLNAIGVEKFAIPTPVASVPEFDEASEQFQLLQEVLEKFVSHESQYIMKPTSVELELVTQTYDPEKVEKSVDAEDRRMVNAFLANFLNLGQGGSSGSYALSNDLSDFFLSGLDYFAFLIEQEINRVIIPQMIKLNRGERQVYPKLVHSGISDKAGKELADTLKAYADSQFIIPDDKTEEFLRKKYSLPKATTQGQRKVQQQQSFFSKQVEVDPVVDPTQPQVDVQKTVLNGAQVTALIDVVSQVSFQKIPRESGVNIIMEAFNISKVEAERLIGPAGKSFEPSNPDTGLHQYSDGSLFKKIKLAEQRKLK